MLIKADIETFMVFPYSIAETSLKANVNGRAGGLGLSVMCPVGATEVIRAWKIFPSGVE